MLPEIYYVSAVRFPSERAHALYVALALSSFAELGCRVHAIVPNRVRRTHGTPQEVYDLPHDVPYTVVPTVDCTFSRFSFFRKRAYFIFTITSLPWICLHALRRRRALFFTNDMIYALTLVVCGVRVVYEMHGYPSTRFRFFYRFVLRRVFRVISNTELKRDHLARDFHIPTSLCIVAPNGVNIATFDIPETRLEARTKLGLPGDVRIILYTGSLHASKGVDTLAEAALKISGEVYFVGGSLEDHAVYSAKYAHIPNVHMYGHVSHRDIPLWLRAADVLVVPQTSKKALSEIYTSPMKVFEYMASKTPIIATDVSSLREVLTDADALFVPPDNPNALANALDTTLEHPDVAEAHAHSAFHRVESTYTWRIRAQRILNQLSV